MPRRVRSNKSKPVIVRIKLRKAHELSNAGYTMKTVLRKRRQILDKLINSQPPNKRRVYALMIFRKLNALYVLNKNIRPTSAKNAKTDRNYIRKKYLVRSI